MSQREGGAAREDPGMSTPSAADVQAAFCAVVADEWARAGVTEAVIAPGARSTPLVVALDAEPRIRVHVVLDERAAGFMALGLGLATGTPAVVATTSGTASAELHPAVVEAFHAGVPLLATTTDRPPELHLVGAPQTIDQEGLFGRAVRWEVSPGVADLAGAGAWRSIASRCVAEALGAGLGGAPGPVHVNLAFREPLLGSPARVPTPPGRDGGAPWHSYQRSVGADLSVGTHRSVGPPPPQPAAELIGAHSGRRGLIVAGAGSGDPDLLLGVAARLGWPVLADPRSGCRLPASAHAPVIAAADALLRIPAIAGWQPEIVLRIGAPWASKVLNAWLGALPPAVPQVLVDPIGLWPDPERTASHVVGIEPGAFLASVRDDLPAPGPSVVAPSDWCVTWYEAAAAAEAVFEARLTSGTPWALSEPAVARAVLAGLPDGARLMTSSSMPVRDVEWFGAPRRGVEVVANRGANGIDGVLSTATGLALADGRPTVALIGDLAFLYDAGSMIWMAQRDLALTVVVVDNDGGGIFSFLPQAAALDAGQFERYWGTPHQLDLAAIAAAYGVGVVEIAERKALDALLSDCSKPGVRVGLVRSDRTVNVEIHQHLNRAVETAVTSAVGALPPPTSTGPRRRALRAGPGRPAGPGA
jgi:2-succinyl-5-enolpyruvyl-6-hydroxy-3-cyclohexene-1-carboxylate synthase